MVVIKVIRLACLFTLKFQEAIWSSADVDIVVVSVSNKKKKKTLFHLLKDLFAVGKPH